MVLKVIGSSSSGNCYILESETSALVIEAGVHPKEVKKAIDFDISKIDGIIVSHVHADHSGYAKELHGSGMKVFAGKDVIEKFGLPGHQILRPRRTAFLGEFKVMPFELEHDVPCFGFLISHEDMGVTAFITDTHYVKYKFPALDHLMIECNYDQDILDDNILEGRLPQVVRNRVMKSHMNIDTVMEMLNANDTSKLKNIVLLHLSAGNSDPKSFCDRVSAETGRTPQIASKGLEINFGKYPF